MQKERSLEYLLIELKKLKLTEEAADKILGSLQKLEKRKAEILTSMTKEAQDFQKLGRIRLEKDEGHLLDSLARTVNLEEGYTHKQIKAIRRSYIIIKDIESDLIDNFTNTNAAKDFFSFIDSIFSIFFEGFVKIDKRLLEERAFITSWKGGFFSYFVIRRARVLKDFKGKILELLKIYEEEATYKKGLLVKISGCKEKIQEKANKLVLSEETAYRKGRLSQAMAQQYREKVKPMIEAVEETTKAATTHTDASESYFNIGFALAGDIIDNGEIDLSAGFFLGGLLGD